MSGHIIVYFESLVLGSNSNMLVFDGDVMRHDGRDHSAMVRRREKTGVFP